MKKKFKLEDLDCANCAAKMEDGIKKINGVKDASVSFMTQKMTIAAEEEPSVIILLEIIGVYQNLLRTYHSKTLVFYL